MSLLKSLEHLLGAGRQQPHGQPSHQAPSQAIPLQTQGRTEDSRMVMGAQGLVPAAADIAHFNRRGQGMQEDQYAAPSQQGFTPLNADIAHFRVPQPQVSRMPFNPGFTPLQNSGMAGPGYGANLQGGMQPRWQNLGQEQPNMLNPQVRDNGYYWNN